MVIKKYIANTANEAMTRIKYELGTDAIIISQRKIRQPGVKGIFLPKVVEVTAAVENHNPSNAVKRSLEAIEQKAFSNIGNRFSERDDEVKEANESINSFNSEVLKELQEMKKVFNKITNTKDPIEALLMENDVEENIAADITAQVKKESSSGENTKEVLLNILKDYIHINNEEIKGNVVLVGPTGVGKTTTIAKLAGRLSLIEKKKVGLITVDTYRIGAVEQLKTYAEIMNLPFAVVITLKEMETAVESMKDCDVVLIDTTGRSSKNKMQISELRAFIQKADSTNINLVLSSITKSKDISNIIEGYRILNFNNVIITKLDETNSYGGLLSVLKHCKTPLSFITTGQNVPEDITVPTKERISKLIIGEENIC
ncbi:flagellar biosynthesis protein FlhF [Clostridium polynesiense]|uniref:flagellar biosynthesis protein FlhF n=1 Tax=Clostridium polynesiense TaxID=1325933 RepID=UPI00058B9401|nr:flagellar biosynthesis protein FlhF [Clostridium polynesiense]